MKQTCLVVFVFVVCVTRLLGQEVGNATFYHHKFQGNRTSDGGTYHKDSMTCAHRTYPLGMLLLVKNPRNRKEVIVKVTDRGPFSRRFMIDLSYRAADALDIIHHGIAPVEVTPYETILVPYRPQLLKTNSYLETAISSEDAPLPMLEVPANPGKDKIKHSKGFLFN